MGPLEHIALASSLALLATAGSASSAPGPPSNALEAWGRVLENYHHQGGLDYAALQRDRSDLAGFLESLQMASLSDADRWQQMAFWINAYNAVVVHFVLERFPEISSVKDVPGFFDELRFTVAGQAMTLDEIESRARALGDPRVHFAVVCASNSCPDLRSEPYRGEALEAQLEADTRRFLADRDKGLRWDRERQTLHLSSIFKWYAGDFTGGSTLVAFFARGRVLDWILPHLPEELATELRRTAPSIRYLDYDWSLNYRPRPHPGP